MTVFYATNLPQKSDIYRRLPPEPLSPFLNHITMQKKVATFYDVNSNRQDNARTVQ